MDRGYIDFERLFRLSDAGSFLCDSYQSNLKVQRRYSRKVDKSTGLICESVVLTPFFSRKGFDAPLRRIRFKDPQSGKTLVFLTNNFVLPALTIIQLYRLRWRIELFFKWIKQHLRIKAFFGITENAVKTQIWIAISVYVLVAIIKKTAQPIGESLQTSTDFEPNLVRKNFTNSILADSNSAIELLKVHKQLNLFN
jgi:IS4 transposase